MEKLEALGISGKFYIFLEASPLTGKKKGTGLYFGAEFSKLPSLSIWRNVDMAPTAVKLMVYLKISTCLTVYLFFVGLDPGAECCALCYVIF